MVTFALIWAGSVALSGIALRRLAAAAPRRAGADAGSTTLEFTLAFPAFLVSVFTAMQSTLLLHAQLVVDYAAFASARSASVWIDGIDGNEERLSGPQQRESRTRVLRAAALACIPISPTVSQLGAAASAGSESVFQNAMTQAIGQLGGGAPGGATLARDAAQRWPYAEAFTTVVLRSGGAASCSDRQALVEATVEHKFRMAIPFIGPIWSRALGGGRLPGVPGSYYAPLRARYVMRRWSCEREV